MNRGGCPNPSLRPPPLPTLSVSADYEAMSRSGADFIMGAIRRVPDALVCLPTGSSPARAYELLAAHGRSAPELFGRVRWLKLDEWGGLPIDHPATCERYLLDRLMIPLEVPAARFFGWQSQPEDADAECERMADWLAAHGPIALSVLGLGLNGHLGFNEPAPALQPGPHVAALSPTSLTHSMLGGERAGVRYGLTLGMADILHSRRLLLLVNGAHKAEAMRRLSDRRITPEFPASFLWLHPALTIIADQAALAETDVRRFHTPSMGKGGQISQAGCHTV